MPCVSGLDLSVVDIVLGVHPICVACAAASADQLLLAPPEVYPMPFLSLPWGLLVSLGFA